MSLPLPFQTDICVASPCIFSVYNLNVVLEKIPSLCKIDLDLKYQNSTFQFSHAVHRVLSMV